MHVERAVGSDGLVSGARVRVTFIAEVTRVRAGLKRASSRRLSMTKSEGAPPAADGGGGGLRPPRAAAEAALDRYEVRALPVATIPGGVVCGELPRAALTPLYHLKLLEVNELVAKGRIDRSQVV